MKGMSGTSWTAVSSPAHCGGVAHTWGVAAVQFAACTACRNPYGLWSVCQGCGLCEECGCLKKD